MFIIWEADQAVPVEYGKRYEIYLRLIWNIPEAPHGYSHQMREELYEHIIRNILREEGDQ